MGYALERWLYRLSLSPHADQFVLKGALMLVVWRIPTTRPTRDIDLLARTSNNLDAVRELVAEICSTPVQGDGLSFDAEKVTTTRIAEDALYEGVRATFPGAIGSTKVAIQLDLGFSDLITPGPDRITFPCLLGQAPPVLAAYNRETAIAEKYEAMVKLGELNSRMKDFFDIWALAQSGPFAGAVLSATIRQIFSKVVCLRLVLCLQLVLSPPDLLKGCMSTIVYFWVWLGGGQVHFNSWHRSQPRRGERRARHQR